MHMKKKILIIGVLCVVVLAGVLGGFAIASANDSRSTRTTMMDKVAEIYQKNTGTAIDAQELQKAFTEAGASIQQEMRDKMLQKLVDDGKITQEQADAWKAWLDARPDKALTDEYKAWLEARPSIPGLFGDGKPGTAKPDNMPSGGRQFGMRGFGMGPGGRGCLPDTDEQ
jgi:hypothetical protein